MIIALIGAKGSGKSTLAKQLVEELEFVRLPFARPIKEMLRTLLSIQQVTPIEIDSMLDGSLKEIPTHFLNGQTPRYAMQKLGTEWRDMISRELWTGIWARSLSLWNNHDIVVDDMRFLHEENAVRKLGGHIIRVDRLDQARDNTHISETEFLKIKPDLIILNVENRPEAMLNSLYLYLPQLKDLNR